jgi:hypothetical protein
MASIITDYTTLVQALQETAEDFSSEFASFIPVAVSNAERRLFREFDLVGKRVSATPAVTKGIKQVPKPPNFLVARSMFWVDPVSGRRAILKKKTPDYLNVFWPQDNQEEVPRYYAEVSDTQFVLAPTPSSTSAIYLEYEAIPSQLSSSNPTNIFTKHTPDLLFQASMVELNRFSRNPEMQNSHEAAYQYLKRYMGAEALRSLKDDGVSFGNPQGQSLQQIVSGQV